MSIISGLLNQNIGTICSTTTDEYNDETNTTIYTSIKCRWEEKIGRVVGKDAEEVTYRVRAFILPSYSVDWDYTIIKGGTTFKIVGKETATNLFGETDHTVLYLI